MIDLLNALQEDKVTILERNNKTYKVDKLEVFISVIYELKEIYNKLDTENYNIVASAGLDQIEKDLIYTKHLKERGEL